MQFDKPTFGDREYTIALQLGRRLAFCVEEEQPTGVIEQSALLEEVKDLVRTHHGFRYDTTRHQCVLAEAVTACFLGLRDGLNDPSRIVQDILTLPMVTPTTAKGLMVPATMRGVSAEALVNVAPHPNEALADISREHDLWLDDKAVRDYERNVVGRWEARSRQRQRERELRAPEEALAFSFDQQRPSTPGF